MYKVIQTIKQHTTNTKSGVVCVEDVKLAIHSLANGSWANSNLLRPKLV